MRRAVTILSLTTAAFAASTVYLARELYRRDAGARPDTTVAAAPAGTPWVGAERATPSSGKLPPMPAAAAAQSQRKAANTSASTPGAAGKKDDAADGALQFARQFLARFDDPVQHAGLLDEARAGIRRQYAPLKDRLKLNDATFEQLVTILAEKTVQLQEQFSRCAVDSACDSRYPLRNSAADDSSPELLALLGPEHMEAFDQFRGSIGERDAVVQLRGRLSDANFLPEAQAEQLIRALAEARQQYSQEASQRGQNVRGWGTQNGVLMYTDDSGSVDQYLAEATAYSQRLRQRAAAVLTPAQFAVFVQMQDELLAQMANYLRPPASRADKVIVQSR
jgi:hypothetical protein